MYRTLVKLSCTCNAHSYGKNMRGTLCAVDLHSPALRYELLHETCDKRVWVRTEANALHTGR
jgi:hypothetical protein